jgi:hypothetical protein
MVCASVPAVKGQIPASRTAPRREPSIAARRLSLNCRIRQNRGMFRTLLAEPVLPGATWRPLTLNDTTALEAAVEATRVADGGQESGPATSISASWRTPGAAAFGVDAENPTVAVGIYERVGFVVNRRFVRLRRAVAG